MHNRYPYTYTYYHYFAWSGRGGAGGGAFSVSSADKNEKREELQQLLAKLTVKDAGRSAPTGRKPIGIENIPRLERSSSDR